LSVCSAEAEAEEAWYLVLGYSDLYCYFVDYFPDFDLFGYFETMLQD